MERLCHGVRLVASAELIDGVPCVPADRFGRNCHDFGRVFSGLPSGSPRDDLAFFVCHADLVGVGPGTRDRKRSNALSLCFPQLYRPLHPIYQDQVQFMARKRFDKVKVASFVLPHEHTDARMDPANRVHVVKRNIKPFLEPVVGCGFHNLEGARLLLAGSGRQRNIRPMEGAVRSARQPDAFIDVDETVRLVVPFPRPTRRADIEGRIDMSPTDVKKTKRSEAVRFNDVLKRSLQGFVTIAVLYRRNCFVNLQIKTPQNLGMSQQVLVVQDSNGPQETSGV